MIAILPNFPLTAIVKLDTKPSCIKWMKMFSHSAPEVNARLKNMTYMFRMQHESTGYVLNFYVESKNLLLGNF